MAVNYSKYTTKQLEAMKKANSSDWHTAGTQQERDALHDANVEINKILDSRKGTSSTFDSGTGKWSTSSSGGSSGSKGGSGSTGSKGSSSGGSTWSDILAMGKGPLSQEAAANYAATGTPTTDKRIVSSGQTVQANPGYTQEQMDQAVQDALNAQRQQSQYDQSEQLRRQKAAETEAALAALKGAYESSIAGYGRAADALGDQYANAKNQAAAQAALARKAFAEQAQASGLNYGVTGQAELARSSMLQRELAGLDSDQAGKLADLDVERTKLQADYEAAIARAKADGDASLANALYQELVRVQELQREDELRQEAYAREQEQLQREEIARADAATQAAAEERAKTMAAIGDFSGYRALGYSDDEINRLEAFYRQNMAA
ncbi:MAG: hypothetical protein J6J81_04990, partial [Oscillospiraceae bacterium]|nr:hypothetical protein [Oscillospiraceae bacterium]